ncbi:MAG: type II 3-dehydroquinate dehydratase [Bacteroidales bacterium]|jgi:3-dehydroquinate dehydratase-2|nr:type II 3-dehydroquinate dehydratase [Bacteroidales bacterium]
MKILIINGPNLNLLGRREPGIYGAETFEKFLDQLREIFPQVEIEYFQSNIEGEIVDRLHQAGFGGEANLRDGATHPDGGLADGVVLNAGAYTHTSVAIHDAIKAIKTPVIEVHISNVHQREEFRHHSYISPAAAGIIVGFGLDGYRLAIEGLMRKSNG